MHKREHAKQSTIAGTNSHLTSVIKDINTFFDEEDEEKGDADGEGDDFCLKRGGVCHVRVTILILLQ